MFWNPVRSTPSMVPIFKDLEDVLQGTFCSNISMHTRRPSVLQRQIFWALGFEASNPRNRRVKTPPIVFFPSFVGQCQSSRTSTSSDSVTMTWQPKSPQNHQQSLTWMWNINPTTNFQKWSTFGGGDRERPRASPEDSFCRSGPSSQAESCNHFNVPQSDSIPSMERNSNPWPLTSSPNVFNWCFVYQILDSRLDPSAKGP